MIAAVDIGGTKTLVAVFNDAGKVVEELKFQTPINYDEFINELTISVAKLATKDFSKTAVAVPGFIDRKHGIGIVFGNLPWHNVTIQSDCEKIFKSPVVIENDANLAGLSEADIVKKEYRKVLYVTISTGIGSGLIIDDIIDPDFEDAEVGSMLMDNRGKLMPWEDFASGKAIVKKFGKKASEITDPKSWYIIAHNIALGIITLIATLTPEIIIIGGGVGSHFDKFKDRLNEDLKIYENPLVKIPPIIQAQRAEEAVIYGCYLITKPNYGRNTH